MTASDEAQLAPQPKDAVEEPILRFDVLANNGIHWRNGVYDMLFYNGLLLDADLVEADPRSVVIADRTVWSGFIDPTPTQVLVF